MIHSTPNISINMHGKIFGNSSEEQQDARGLRSLLLHNKNDFFLELVLPDFYEIMHTKVWVIKPNICLQSQSTRLFILDCSNLDGTGIS